MLINEVKKTNKSIPETISYLLEKIFGIVMDSTKIKEIFMNMKLSDIIDLDVAFTNKDEDSIRKILNLDLNEYSMPGRSNIKSSAPEINKTQIKTPSSSVADKSVNIDNNKSSSTTGTMNADELKLQQELETKEKEQEDLKSELEILKKTAGIKT
jgi:hypothetical protein